MLAAFFLWMIAATLLDVLTVLPRWMCALIPAIAIIVWIVKRPEDF